MQVSELLHGLVSIYSPSQHEQPAVDFLVNWMQHNGFNAFRDEVGNAVGIRGAENASHTLMLLGHIDTVPGEIVVRVENGCLYGRGSVDAKGSLCTFAEATAQATIPNDWRVIVVGALEEEIATSKGACYIRDSYDPDWCIIGEPSSAERLTLGYKGRLIVEFTLSQPIAHTARPEPSVGALAVDFWQAVQAWAEGINAERHRVFDQVLARLRSINTSSDGFHDSVNMTIGFRLPPDCDPQSVFTTISDFAPDDAQLSIYGAEKAFLSDKNNGLVRGMLSAIRAQGSRPAFVVKSGTSDMNVVGAKWACPIIAYGPGDSNLDHTPNENLPLAEYGQAVATLRHFINGLADTVVT